LVDTPNREVAARMTKKEFPLLREVAKLVAGGFKFNRVTGRFKIDERVAGKNTTTS